MILGKGVKDSILSRVDSKITARHYREDRELTESTEKLLAKSGRGRL